MDTWTCSGIDGQMEGLNEWTDGATNRRNGRTNRLDGQADVKMDRYGWTNRQTYRLEGQIEDWMDGPTDIPTGRRMDRQMDAWNGETRKGPKGR